MGVAGDKDEDGETSQLVRELMKELIFSAVFWKQSTREDILFILKTKNVRDGGSIKQKTFIKAYAGRRGKFNNNLTQKAQEFLDNKILNSTDGNLRRIEYNRNLKAYALRQARDIPFFEEELKAFHEKHRFDDEYMGQIKEGFASEKELTKFNSINNTEHPYSFASRIFGSSSGSSGKKMVAVGGQLQPKEAKMLLKELTKSKEHRHALRELGHVFIQIERKRIIIKSECINAEERLKIMKFVKDFSTIITLSDLHIAGNGGADNFGKEKEKHLVRLLDRAIKLRCRVVINGDLFELWQQRYGNIKIAYPLIFEKLRKVRRLIVVAGNHD